MRRRPPRRRPVLATSLVAAVALLALCAGCAAGRGGAASRLACARPAPGAPAGVAARYLRALALHRYDDAERDAACTDRDPSLRALWLWLARMPAADARVWTGGVTAGGGKAAVSALIFARFGRPPYSSWVRVAHERVRLRRAGGRWRVQSVTAERRGSDLGVYGAEWMRHPYFVSGSRVTVVYGATAQLGDAEQILTVADAAARGLVRVFGASTAARRPVLFLIANRRQGERLAHVQLGRVRTPAGFQYSSFAYVDLPRWRSLPSLEQRSMVVHELTHVATRPLLEGAPHSLVEGVAMEEEDRYLRSDDQTVSLAALAAAYAHGFPSLEVWRRRTTDWGLGNVEAIGLCYDDALAMTHVIMAHHGGVAALRRLGREFSRTPRRGDLATAAIDTAFRRALGVPFARVVAEAHVYALGQAPGG